MYKCMKGTTCLIPRNQDTLSKAYYGLNQVGSTAFHHVNHPVCQQKFSLLVMLSTPSSETSGSNPTAQFSSINQGHLCQKVAWQQLKLHWTHLVTDIFQPALHFPLLSSLRRMHRYLLRKSVVWRQQGVPGTVGYGLEVTLTESHQSITSAIFVLSILITLSFSLPDMNRIQCSRKTYTATNHTVGQSLQVRGGKPHKAPCTV